MWIYDSYYQIASIDIGKDFIWFWFLLKQESFPNCCSSQGFENICLLPLLLLQLLSVNLKSVQKYRIILENKRFSFLTVARVSGVIYILKIIVWFRNLQFNYDRYMILTSNISFSEWLIWWWGVRLYNLRLNYFEIKIKLSFNSLQVLTQINFSALLVISYYQSALH